MFRLLALIACSIQFVGFHALGSCMSANPPGDYGIKEVKLSDVLYYAQGITRSGGLEEAEKIYERAIALHVWDNASELLVLYVSAAETALMRHDFSRADEYYQKTVRLLEENADLPNEYKIALAAMYIKFGADIDDYLSDPVKGEYYFNLGVALNPQASPRQQASYHYEKGVYSATQGKYVQALASYMKALELYERLQDPKGLINVYNSLSYLHCRKKEAAPARHYLEKTLNVLQEQGVDIALLPWVCDTAGAVYALDGAYAEAEKYFRLTLEGVTNDASYPPARIGRYYENLGDVLAKQNKEAEALVAWQTALEYFKKAGISDAEKEVVEKIFNLKR